jgi:hypothetical protein
VSAATAGLIDVIQDGCGIPTPIVIATPLACGIFVRPPTKRTLERGGVTSLATSDPCLCGYGVVTREAERVPKRNRTQRPIDQGSQGPRPIDKEW